MNQWMKRFRAADDCACGEGEDCCCGHLHDEELTEEDSIIEIEDPETGEKFSFEYADEFEFEGENYCVLVTLDEENPEYVIGRIVEGEDGDSYIETLDEDHSDAVYEAYEALLEEYFDDEDDDEDGEDEDEEGKEE